MYCTRGGGSFFIFLAYCGCQVKPQHAQLFRPHENKKICIFSPKNNEVIGCVLGGGVSVEEGESPLDPTLSYRTLGELRPLFDRGAVGSQ